LQRASEILLGMPLNATLLSGSDLCFVFVLPSLLWSSRQCFCLSILVDVAHVEHPFSKTDQSIDHWLNNLIEKKEEGGQWEKQKH
jgi:hypothetical protein